MGTTRDVIVEILSMKSSPGGKSSKEQLLDGLVWNGGAQEEEEIKVRSPHYLTKVAVAEPNGGGVRVGDFFFLVMWSVPAFVDWEKYWRPFKRNWKLWW